ncbi:MAG: insulinase family protein [Planctomycetota bacterium]
MTRFLVSTVILLSTVVGCVGRQSIPAPIVDVDQPRVGQERESRYLTLDNGLEVWLISDPEVQKSAAALDVAVGSLEDPWEHLGLAHFLEHLLFLGTEKYPDVEGYSQYLEDHQGYSNAYTAAERTNYHFEVDASAFEGAYDRFAQFFIAPLFTPEFVEREMNAVHSEHQKNLQDDYWRARMVKRSLHKDGHPRQKFSTGDLNTLKNVTREELIAFYEKYYSANVMKLCVLSNHSLDELEAWTREKFAAVENRDRAPLEYSSDVFDEDQLPQLIQVKPISDTISLELTFATPSVNNLWASKPHRLLGALIGDEGPGSLLSRLKNENLATSLSAGARSESYAAYFSVNIGLTDEGRESIDRVVELFFSYVRLLERTGLERYYYEERKVMADLDYYYRENEEGADHVSWLAGRMQVDPAATVDARTWLLSEYDAGAFEEYLSYLQPNRLRATLVAPDVQIDRVEPAYGTEFSVTTLPEEAVKTWSEVDVHPALSYPRPNPFIPDDVTVLAAKRLEEPVEILTDLPGEFWYQIDHRFGLPRGAMSVLFTSDLVNASPRNRLLTKMWAKVMAESLNEWKYPAIEAGLSVDISDEGRGIRVVLNGYSQRMTDFLRAVAERMADAHVDDDAFAAIRAETARELANADYAQAYTLAFYELNLLGRYPGVHRDLYRDLVEAIDREEVEAFAAKITEEMTVEGAAFGNLRHREVEEAIDTALSTISAGVLSADRVPRSSTVEITSGRQFARVISSKSNNNAWLEFNQFGDREPKAEALARAAAALVGTGFYGEMRTKQQLGYIVSSAALTSFERVGVWFLVQSGTHRATDCAERAHAYLEEAIPALDAMTEAQFAPIRSALAAELTREEKDYADSLENLLFEGVTLEGRIGYRDAVAAEMERLTLDHVRTALRERVIGDRAASFSVYVDAAGLEPSQPKETVIRNREEFRNLAAPNAAAGGH